MHKAPHSYAGRFDVRNGDPTLAMHAAAIDQSSTWMACHRRRRPALIGPFTSGTTYEITTEIPALCSSLRVWAHGSGKGSVAITASTDTYDCTIYMATTPGSPTGISYANWVFPQGPVSVASDGTERELDITWDTAPQSVRLTWTITDDPDLVIHALLVDPVYPSGINLSTGP